MLRNFAILLAVGVFLPAMSGCTDIRPLYGTGGTDYGESVAVQLADIDIPEPQSRIEQLIRNDLISSMSVPGARGGGQYTLRLVPVEQVQSAYIDQRSEISRKTYLLNVSYALIGKASGEILYQGKTFSQVSYDRITSEFANMQAKTNAQERAAGEVAQDIRVRLAAFFTNYRPSQVALN